MPPFTRLIRFLSTPPLPGPHYGVPILPSTTTDITLARNAYLLHGDPLSQTCTVTTTILPITRLLSPLPSTRVPTIRCLGLNYAAHAREAHMPCPSSPVLFYKPSTAVGGAGDDIVVPKHAREEVDYECELVVVIGREGRDIPRERALEYVLGYAVGNDVSARDWQLRKSGGQWGVGKGFDGWAPFGPGIVTTQVLGAAKGLEITTRVNGQVRQRSETGDMVFGVEETVSFLSRGTTLRRGDLVFMGTPSGVGMGMTPKGWLKHGDVVEVELEGVGRCTNRVVVEGEGETDAKL